MGEHFSPPPPISRDFTYGNWSYKGLTASILEEGEEEMFSVQNSHFV